jgi:hypothetical protein
MFRPRSKYYDNPDCVRFVKTMRKNGLKVQHYNGRFFWEGPAVVVRSIQDALSLTRVKCQWDSMGLDYIVYPVSKGRLNAMGLAAKAEKSAV